MQNGDFIIYKGCLIDYLPHPKLFGQYEVCNEEETWTERASSVGEAKEIINQKQRVR